MSQKLCILLLGCLVMFLWYPHPTHAQSQLAAEQLQIDTSSVPALQRSWWQTMLSYIGIKRNSSPRIPVGTVLRVQSSAYAPSRYQTDATPCITASGTTVRPGVVATNFLPLGTIISIQNKKYIVEDRMNSRYKGYYLDIWFPSTSEALEFGRKKLEILIVGYGKPGDSLESPPPTPVPSADKKSVLNKITQSAFYIGQLLASKANPNRHDVACY